MLSLGLAFIVYGLVLIRRHVRDRYLLPRLIGDELDLYATLLGAPG